MCQPDAIEAEVAQVFEEQNALVRKTTSPLVRAIVGTGPFAGGVSSLLGDAAQRRQELRLRKFLVSLAHRIEGSGDEMERKLDADFLGTDEFAAVLESVLQEAARSADKEKMATLEGFLLSSTYKIRPDETWQNLFLQYVRQLSGIHLVVLATFSELQGVLPSSDRLGGVEIPGKVPMEIPAVVEALDEADEPLVRVACVDLANLGLLVDWRALRSEYDRLQQAYVLSDSGALFVSFVTGQWRGGGSSA